MDSIVTRVIQDIFLPKFNAQNSDNGNGLLWHTWSRKALDHEWESKFRSPDATLGCHIELISPNGKVLCKK